MIERQESSRTLEDRSPDREKTREATSPIPASVSLHVTHRPSSVPSQKGPGASDRRSGESQETRRPITRSGEDNRRRQSVSLYVKHRPLNGTELRSLTKGPKASDRRSGDHHETRRPITRSDEDHEKTIGPIPESVVLHVTHQLRDGTELHSLTKGPGSQ